MAALQLRKLTGRFRLGGAAPHPLTRYLWMYFAAVKRPKTLGRRHIRRPALIAPHFDRICHD